MKTSIIILTHNKLEYTKKCIESIRKYTQSGTYEMIIIDNNSTDGTTDWLRRQKDLRVIYNKKNVGFPKGCNQGIEVAKGDNILLLNNDTVVTSNWLANLTKCLYSSEDIGAVGAITNNCSYYQAINVQYKSLDEMHAFASKHNQSNPQLWEERLKLVGFCMLIKREVIDKIGLLDEMFTPGNFEDDDYSLRIRLAGYRLILCKDTFIHHFGSVSFKQDNGRYAQLLAENRKKFIAKWGFDSTYSTSIRNEIIDLIDAPKGKEINVLEIGCACGGTLLKIKDLYKKANLHGIELNENAAKSAKLFANVIATDVENGELSYPENYFDYIILADVLEHLHEPWTVITQLKKYLRQSGQILASIPNIMHFTVIKNLLHGRWSYEDAGILDKTYLRFFTLSEIEKMFTGAGYSIKKTCSTVLRQTEADTKFIEQLVSLSGNGQLYDQFKAYQYIIIANKAEYIASERILADSAADIDTQNLRQLTFVLRRIENDIHKSDNLDHLIKALANGSIKSDDILRVVKKDIIKKEELLQTIAVHCEKRDMFEVAFSLLEYAYTINPQNSDTVFNLAHIAFRFGEKEVALKLLNRLENKDEEINSFIQTLMGA